MLRDTLNQQLLFEDVAVGLGSTSSYAQSKNDLFDDDDFRSEEEESSDSPAKDLDLGLAIQQSFPRVS